MEESARSQSMSFYSILGIPRSASLSDIGKAYKSLVMRWNSDKNPSNKTEAEYKFKAINEAYRVLSTKKREENNGLGDDELTTLEDLFNYESADEGDNGSRRGNNTSTSSPRSFFSRNGRSTSGATTPKSTPTTPSAPTTPNSFTPSLSKDSSRRETTPIIYSKSSARRKPQPIEKQLECTLEELCHGCVKKIKIKRDVISDAGMFIQEEEILKIKVKPGWRKGTKITFEGKGDERPGTLPADIIFVIDEKRHPVFKTEGDDLELGVEIPLIDALTGCTITVPLLGGANMTLSFDDIIYPGFEKIIPGQGMPIQGKREEEQGRRGDLRLNFLVEFPTELSDERRSDVVGILTNSS
ncbi:hypothetical protein F0562_020301 [Nyssa sinensis]|uniref:J domain-containing protein n=1 Tax=Nyssa sinensis TaxID=561372 RepID=A0A5J5BUS2_9ASTE|nr:hypothetical protein F0562_020301 [Nyssa sinensis]